MPYPGLVSIMSTHNVGQTPSPQSLCPLMHSLKAPSLSWVSALLPSPLSKRSLLSLSHSLDFLMSLWVPPTPQPLPASQLCGPLILAVRAFQFLDHPLPSATVRFRTRSTFEIGTQSPPFLPGNSHSSPGPGLGGTSYRKPSPSILCPRTAYMPLNSSISVGCKGLSRQVAQYPSTQ